MAEAETASWSALNWVTGNYEHRAALNRFTCADPAKALYDPHRGKYHPRQWELDVQSGIRGLMPPLPNSESLLLALEPDGEIAAAVRVSFDSEFEQLLILAIATSTTRRRQGLGTEALRFSLETLRLTKQKYGLDCAIWARIHRLNDPSRRLFLAAGFEHVHTDRELEVWLHVS